MTPQPLGMKWEEVGLQRPENGEEVKSPTLATALHRRKMEFNEAELRQVLHPPRQPAVLHENSYIKVSAGLKWTSAGNRRPADGRELFNDRLSIALRGTTDFTQLEWDAFGIDEMRSGDFIQSGAAFLKPSYQGDRFFRPVDDMQVCRHCDSRAKAHEKGKPCASSDRCLHCRKRAAAEKQNKILQSITTEELKQELVRRQHGEHETAQLPMPKPGAKLRAAVQKMMADSASEAGPQGSGAGT